MGRGWQLLVALRYLRMREPRSPRIHIVTAMLLVWTLLAVGFTLLVDYGESRWMIDMRIAHGATLRLVRLGAVVGFVLIEAFVLMVRRLTIFTTISTYGLFLGSGALVIVLSVMSGFEHDLRRKILGANAHVVVTTPDHAFTGYEDVQNKLAAVPGVLGVSPYLTNEVMISSQSNLSGVVLKGIDPATVGKVTDLEKNTRVGGLDYLQNPEKLLQVPRGPSELDEDDGEPPRPSPSPDGARKGEPVPPPPDAANQRVLPAVMIGQELGKNLRLYLRDDVDIVSPLGGIGPTGAIPKSKPFRVGGVFFSGMFEYDSKYVYMTIPAAQKFLGLEDEVTGLELKVKDPDDTETVVKRISALLGKGYEVRDWKDLNRNLFSALKLEKILMFVILCFITLVAAFSIIANGIMLVMERGREISILKAMGATDQGVLGVFVILGGYIGALGTGAGILLGCVACTYLSRFGLALDPDVYYITQLPVKMNAWEIGAVALAGQLIAVLATLYPAIAAARMRPVEGLH